MPLVSFQMVSKYFGAQCVLQDISWGIEPGHHVGLIGSNGAGKTTILQLITGELPVSYTHLTLQTIYSV